nr:HAMP domain-containing histidine kinase [Deltaproteobacteria bacterium]
IKDRGVTLGVISFIAAESGRHYADEDLQMAEQLAERAGAAIGNAKLYADAREAIRIRDEFMLIAGHELRTPLASLALHHEALTNLGDTTPLDKVRERGKKLQHQTARMARLVEELLDVSRIAAGRLTLEIEELDLGVFAREVADRMREDFERARCPLELHLEPTQGRWDKGRVDQILTNLLANAVKYGRGAPISLRVSGDATAAKITVVDHGIGIAAVDQPRIFHRFERAVSPRKFGGLGLGLWITAQLVDAHLGSIEVISQPGEGATFIVTLPLDGAARSPA